MRTNSADATLFVVPGKALGGPSAGAGLRSCDRFPRKLRTEPILVQNNIRGDAGVESGSNVSLVAWLPPEV